MTAADRTLKHDHAVAIIPARYASTRFPAKPLADRTGKCLVQHVYERAAAAATITRVIVATDDRRIFDAVRAFGGEAMMTRADHVSGTDRLAEVAAGLDDELIVNVQGDEPEIEPGDLDLLVRTLAGGDCPMATLACPYPADDELTNPNLVKVVLDRQGRALYFSRSPIPFVRDAGAPRPDYLLHRGTYGYRRDFLLAFASLPQGVLEQTEKLEQLRVLEAGYDIAVAVTAGSPAGIDTPEQYEAFVRRWRNSS
ncbi:MAG: 3-deoxy-manno-octulosonate cytidylyltransferase [Phycisphaerae bacterium]|nr:3-deoxy-manno-octulosonate cytidylyltransferase [Phycisphaerae bacterium]